MRISKKVLSLSIFAMVALSVANAALANRGQVTAVPVRVMANSTQSAWFDSFDLTGQTDTSNSSGLTLNCPMDTNGYIQADISLPGTTNAPNPSGNRLWALVLAAEQANKSVTVLLDDTVKDSSGNCEAVWIYM